MNADLSERRQRDGQAVPGRILFVQRDAALGQRQRLIVAMPHHRDVGLVAADNGDARRRRRPAAATRSAWRSAVSASS